MPEKILIIGAGALARDIISMFGADVFTAAFVEPGYLTATQTSCEGLAIVSDWGQAVANATHYVLGVSDIMARKKFSKLAREAHLLPASPLISPYVVLAKSCKIGCGTAIGSFVTLGPGCEIGEDVIIMHKVTVAHDCKIDDLSVVCAGVSLGGYAVVEQECFIGANAVFAPGIRIGSQAVIAAGASCLADVPAAGFAIGSPARRVNRSA